MHSSSSSTCISAGLYQIQVAHKGARAESSMSSHWAVCVTNHLFNTSCSVPHVTCNTLEKFAPKRGLLLFLFLLIFHWDEGQFGPCSLTTRPLSQKEWHSQTINIHQLPQWSLSQDHHGLMCRTERLWNLTSSDLKILSKADTLKRHPKALKGKGTCMVQAAYRRSIHHCK